MNNDRTARTDYFEHLLKKYSILLNFSIAEIQEYFTDYPVIMSEHSRKGVTEKTIQISFDEDELSINCEFNDWGKCDCINLLPDKKELMKEFLDFIKGNYEYNEDENGFVTEICVVKINEMKEGKSCLAIYG